MIVVITVGIIITAIIGISSYAKAHEEFMAIRIIYTLFIGIFLAIFVGVGIAAFYPGPKAPDMPAILKYCSPEITQSAEKFANYQNQAEKFNTAEQAYRQQEQLYSRNVSIASVVAAILIVILSLTLLKTIKLLADGVLFGGVLTLMYSVLRGFGTEDNMFRFIVVTIGLIISLALGYIKFIKKKT